jgi:predicted nuclease with TOPRIM domain
MIYAFISLAVITVGAIAVFVGVNSNHNKEIHVNNERLDKMFEFLRDDIAKVNTRLKNINQEIEALQHIQVANSKRIEKLENEINQLRTGSNSRFY